MGTRLEKLGEWLSHPLNLLLGLFGTIASILSVVFYLQSIETRELTFLIHPVKTTVVKAGRASRLKVSLGEREITNDISAVQIAFWNAGKRPIRRNEILEPIIIGLGTNHAVLEVALRKVTRQLTHVALDQGRLANGEVGISWDILEKLDGGVVQIVYAGDTSVPIQINGVVEGQSQIPLRVLDARITTPEEQYSSRSSGNKISICLVAVLMLNFSAMIYLQRTEHTAFPRFSKAFGFLALLLLATAFLVLFRNVRQHILPFEF
jgi:hypothetical protein